MQNIKFKTVDEWCEWFNLFGPDLIKNQQDVCVHLEHVISYFGSALELKADGETFLVWLHDSAGTVVQIPVSDISELQVFSSVRSNHPFSSKKKVPQIILSSPSAINDTCP